MWHTANKYIFFRMNENNIRTAIEKLLVVQERDVRLSRCKREIAQIPLRRKEVEGEIAQAQEAAALAKSDVKTRQAEMKKIELEIETLRQKIGKLREQQFQIKSNDEFKVLNREIAGLNEEIRKAEDSEIAVMEQIEESQHGEEKSQKDVAAMQSVIQGRLAELDQRKKNLETEVAALAAEREKDTAGISADILAAYNRIFENKGDKAVVGVENSTCAGCHMHLPAHLINEIKKQTAPVTCSFCGRILYLVH